MVRTALSDDGARPNESSFPAWLDDDPGMPDDEWLPSLRVIARDRIGWDDDGNPIYRWVTILEDQASGWEDDRAEMDDASGTTKIVAKTTMLCPEDQEVPENARVHVEDGRKYRVTKVTHGPYAVTLELERAEQNG